MKRIHLIAIGGKAMHNLAITLKINGYEVTGSDDVIYNPSRESLEKYGVLPEKEGWFEEKITENLDAVILGRHATQDNPELIKAQKLGLKIYSYPEFIYEQSKHKKRIVIAGSHGKNTISAIVLHVLQYYEIDCDYLVSADVQGHTGTIRLSQTANTIIIEGDEHVSSTLDERSKFEHYKPHIALLSGIAWDHVNTFPTFDKYLEQFNKYISSIEKGGKLIYSSEDEAIRKIIPNTPPGIKQYSYSIHDYEVFDNRTFLKVEGGRVPIHLFGKHNMRNIAGALTLCQHLKISEEKFYRALKAFKGTSKHLQLIGKSKTVNIYLDFSHTPEKLNATIKAIREQYSNRELIVCLELYSSSSLNKAFLDLYKGSMTLADEKIVYYNPDILKQKAIEDIDDSRIRQAFGSSMVKVFSSVEDVKSELFLMDWRHKNLLLMSSGDFSGLDYKDFTKKIISLSV